MRDSAEHNRPSEIDISHLNKAAVLVALYNRARPAELGHLHLDLYKEITLEEAQTMLDDGKTYFDYLNGRYMKIDLSSDMLFTGLYNEHYGEDAAERIIRALGQPTV